MKKKMEMVIEVMAFVMFFAALGSLALLGDEWLMLKNLSTKFDTVERIRAGEYQPVEVRLGGLVKTYEVSGVKYTRSPAGERIEFEEQAFFPISRNLALREWKNSLGNAGGYKEIEPGVYEIKGTRVEITTPAPTTIKVLMKPSGVRGLFM